MTDDKAGGPTRSVDSDLVEYLIVSLVDLDSLPGVVPALAELVAGGTLRILDLVAIEKGSEGDVTVIEPEAIQSLAALVNTVAPEGLLSERDLLFASTALVPETAALILVVEDQWAERLSDAAKRAGGRVIAGERIPRLNVEAAIAHMHNRSTEG